MRVWEIVNFDLKLETKPVEIIIVITFLYEEGQDIHRYLKATIGYLAAMIPIEGVESLPKLSLMVLLSHNGEKRLFCHFSVCSPCFVVRGPWDGSD